MKRRIIYLFIFISFFSCKKGHWGDCFMGTGDVKTENRTLNSFTEVELYDNINVILIEGTENKVEIEAGENLIPGITTNVSGGKLKIENTNTCNFMRSYKIPINVYLTYNSLRTFTHYGGGKITCQDTLRNNFYEFIQWFGSGNFELKINNDTLKLGFHTGSGNADIYGKTKELSLYSAGNSIFRCGNLLADKVYINQSSTGDFTVNAISELYVQIYNYGDVFYYGNPALLDQQFHGTGQLIQLP